MRALIRLRPLSLALFCSGVVAAVLVSAAAPAGRFPQEGMRLILFVALAASYVGFLGFLITEAFGFRIPQRSRVNIWVARMSLISTGLVGAGLLVALWFI
jgi:hypothetical protein